MNEILLQMKNQNLFSLSHFVKIKSMHIPEILKKSLPALYGV